MENKKNTGKIFTSKEKFMWSIAAFGTAMISNSYGALFNKFYIDIMGVDAGLIYIAMIIYAIWNAVNDPLVGYWSDSSKSKKGRRVPFMKFTAPFLGLFFIAIWMVPISWGEIAKFWWMLVTILLYDTAYTVVGLVYSALLPEITESDSERGSLQTYSSLLGLLGTIIGFLLPGFLLPGEANSSLSPLYVGVIAIGVVGTILIFITAGWVKERPEFTKVDEPLGLKDAIKFTFKSKSFLVLVSANFMSILMQSLVVGSLYFLADYVMKASSILVLVALFLGLILGVFFANMLAKRIGVVKAQQLLLVIAGISLTSIVFVPNTLNNLMYPILFIAGFGLSGPQVLTNVLFAQVTDEDEIKSGVRREAMFFGVNALITKPAQSLATGIVAGILAWASFISIDDNGGVIQLDQNDNVYLGIRIFIGLIPGVALLLGAFILFLYPLKGDYLKEIQEKVLILHDEKKARLSEQN
ncbi:MAG: MFS transporter [Promethearchaeota archaeon]